MPPFPLSGSLSGSRPDCAPAPSTRLFVNLSPRKACTPCASRPVVRIFLNVGKTAKQPSSLVVSSALDAVISARLTPGNPPRSTEMNLGESPNRSAPWACATQRSPVSPAMIYLTRAPGCTRKLWPSSKTSIPDVESRFLFRIFPVSQNFSVRCFEHNPAFSPTTWRQSREFSSASGPPSPMNAALTLLRKPVQQEW